VIGIVLLGGTLAVAVLALVHALTDRGSWTGSGGGFIS
jgi:hypothetical protein